MSSIPDTETHVAQFVSCQTCLCETCLHFWATNCPFGSCFDDWRARNDPYPGEVRKAWSDWNKPLEQEHWCRGGFTYATHKCPKYVEYDRTKHVVRRCVGCNVEQFQDNSIRCPFSDMMGCEKCIETYLPEESANEE